MTEIDRIEFDRSAPLDPIPPADSQADPFQARVHEWVVACFGEAVADDVVERNHRFLEEALELVQSTGCTADEAHQLVNYVYGRPVGEPFQEVGGVMNTLAALCSAIHLSVEEAAETELARVWTKVAQIRAKQAAKPKHGPLPGPTATEDVRATKPAMPQEAKSDLNTSSSAALAKSEGRG